MSQNPKQVAKETLQKIANDLVKTKREISLTREEVTTIITTHIDHAYNKVASEDKKKLYQTLSLYLHPDKEFPEHPELYSYLGQMEMKDEPFNILNRLNVKNSAEVAKGLQGFLNYLAEVRKPMKESLDRYYQPFRFLAKALYWSVYSLSVVVQVMSAIAIVFAALGKSLANGIINWSLNLFTNDQYKKELDTYADLNMEEHRKAYLKSVRESQAQIFLWLNKEEEADNIRAMSDDQLLEKLIFTEFKTKMTQIERGEIAFIEEEPLMAQIKAAYEQQIKDSAVPTNLSRLKLISITLYNAITQPLDEVEGNIYTSLFLQRPLQILAAPFILGAAAAVDLSFFLVDAARLAIETISSLALLSTLMLLNTPLYAVDGLRYTANKMGCDDCISEKTEEFSNAGPRSMLMLEWHPDNSLSTTEVPPVQSKSLFGNGSQTAKKKDVPVVEIENSFTC
ncbi:MAG: hypothetical protein ACRCXC_09990 [Legionella sp.]